jgi:hypothetical protein
MILHKINKNFGVKIFKNPNTLNYNLFNFFFKRNIVDNNEGLLNSYHKLGYLRPDVDSKELANFLSNKIQNPKAKILEKISNKYSSRFEIDNEMRIKIKDHLNNKFKNIVEALKRYYRSGIAIHNVQIRRNYGIEDTSYYSRKERKKDLEYYNMYFHCDYYTMNYFKLFINLQDISLDHGPLTFYSIEDTKKFVERSNYRDRNFYSDLSLNNEIKNCGKLGDSLILNTPQCIHKAGIPKFGNYRDVLFVNFVAVPEKIDDIFHFEKDYEDDVWGAVKIGLSKKFSKPKNLRETINLYRSFKKNSLNINRN